MGEGQAIRTLLIANRGEIACRIMRTAKRMGIATVAVFSDADAQALHVRSADRAMRIGGPAPVESYLSIGAMVMAAKEMDADAVHPGYGFLSENAEFAEACAAAGLVFVGPPASAIRAMGDKARAKALMAKAGVPVVPGYDGEDQSPARLSSEAGALGYPLLIKAAAGGGGRGMRRVDGPGDFAAALESAQQEARNAFGDPRLLIERLVENGRHIEIQVFADRHGNTIHLGERDCSLQRRHQKVIEEAPSPFVGDDLRNRMGADAVRAAQAVAYTGAGTVEFIVAGDGSYHFLEMNTRLQVEHPVTEAITGFDLVEWQLRVAMGEELPAAQDEVARSGHAVEARLYAEDPYAGFLPQVGPVLHWRPDAAGIRIDTGVAEGDSVTPHYDAMIAKLIAHAPTRQQAIARLEAALLATPLFGLKTNRAFLIDLLRSQAFREGRATTGLIDAWTAEGAAIMQGPSGGSDDDLTIAAAALCAGGDWFRSAGAARFPIRLVADGEDRRVTVEASHRRPLRVARNGGEMEFPGLVFEPPILRWQGGAARVLVKGRDVWIDRDGDARLFAEPDPLEAQPPAGDPSRVVSPVAGLLRSVHAEPGERVAQGQVLAVVEAMKMETLLRAARDGVIEAVHARPGTQVRSGDLVVTLASVGESSG